MADRRRLTVTNPAVVLAVLDVVLGLACLFAAGYYTRVEEYLFAVVFALLAGAAFVLAFAFWGTR